MKRNLLTTCFLLISFFSYGEDSAKPVKEETLSCPQILEVEQLGSPLLRQKARPLCPNEIKSEEIQKLIIAMQDTMHATHGVGMAAPQIGKSIQLIVIEDMDHSHLTQEQIKERERELVPLHVLINPVLEFEGTETACFFEGCLSIPQQLAIVRRARCVRVNYLNERGEQIEVHARGWYARILQHEIDHLSGTLYTDRSFPQTLMTEASYKKYWKAKPIHEILENLVP